MSKVLKAVWDWLDNKKSAIGLTLTLVLAWAEQRGYVPSDTYQLMLAIMTAWGIVAVGHHTVKGVE